MNDLDWIYLLFSSVLAAVIGWYWSRSRAQQEISQLREDNVRLSTQLEAQSANMQEKIQTLEDTREKLESTFKSLASDVLKSSNTEFLKLAELNFSSLKHQANSELEKREKAVENLVKPIRESLDKTDQQIRKMEKDQQTAHGALNQHLELMAKAQQELHGETSNLVKALRRPEVRGQWGELTLRRLAELAGMVQHCDFEQQCSIDTEDGKQRPDMIVHMPAGRDIIVDAKAPMDAYLGAIEAQDETQRIAETKRHARNVRDRVRELASKNYWQSLPNSPDFVVLFIPGDHFLSAALEVDPKLLEDSMTDRIVLATPSSLVALLRAVAFGWRQETLAENAEEIRAVGAELYERLSTFAGHLEKLGNNMNRSVEFYNKAVASFDTRILPSARKFTEMGIQAKKDVVELEPVERLPRDLQNPTPISPDAH